MYSFVSNSKHKKKIISLKNITPTQSRLSKQQTMKQQLPKPPLGKKQFAKVGRQDVHDLKYELILRRQQVEEYQRKQKQNEILDSDQPIIQQQTTSIDGKNKSKIEVIMDTSKSPKKAKINQNINLSFNNSFNTSIATNNNSGISPGGKKSAATQKQDQNSNQPSDQQQN